MIPYARQTISDADIDAVIDVLKSDRLTQGPRIEAFEEAFAAFCGARHAVAVSNGTAALHLAAISAGIEPGRRLWTSPVTFVASANCALYCGGEVDFVDVDQKDGNMSVPALTAKLKAAENDGTLPDVVVPVHLGGHSCDMAAIGALADQYGFRVIEDASHALGGRYADAPVGACVHSEMTTFSFHPVKIITTGEGGMVTCNDADTARRLRRLRSHGITRDPSETGTPFTGGWDYHQLELGYNYRITDLQAALGLSQLGRVKAFIDRRHLIARRYDEAFADLPLDLPARRQDTLSAFHLYVVRLREGATALDRKAFYDELHRRGIAVQIHYIPVHTQPFYHSLGFREGDFPNAEAFYSSCLSLPMYADLTEHQQDIVVSAVHEILS